MSNRTLYRMFQETAARCGSSPAFGTRPSRNSDYTYLTYNETAQKVKDLARGLDALGLKRGDTLALLSENRTEWALVDLASHLLGLVIVAPYTTLPAVQAGFIIRDSEARAIIVADKKLLAKVGEFRAETPKLEYVITLDSTLTNGQEVIDFASLFLATGRSDAELDTLASAVSPDDIATLIYTSGTTGEPKGAMLTHLNLLQTPDAVVEHRIADVGVGDVFLSFLPLSHITERMGYYIALRAGACTTYSLGLSALTEEIQTVVRPTLMLCVPRLWENIYSKAHEGLAKQEPSKRKKVEWGLKVGTAYSEKLRMGKPIGLLLRLQHAFADKLILSKIREKTTGGRLRYCVSGGAPLDTNALSFFLGIGIELLEGYGLSETSIIAINRPGKERVGTVGTLLPKAEVKIAEDGEILMRGQGRMKGYFRHAETTAEAINAEGWFHTGDIGELSVDGYLKITDRKKDLLVLSNGKKVAPQPIEAELKHSDWIGEAVLFGDRQSTVSALIVPAFDKLLGWAKQNSVVGSAEELIENAEVQKIVKTEIDKVNATLPDYERIKRFRLLPKPFSIEAGELTPTLKVRRKVVAENYASILASFARD
ncbi:AMP-dependent synthetase [Armatimonadota bacterium]|nr:AMP-dependent synthetase [Armatimonadota bacterium]